jgi:hypothetical protein
MHISVVGGSSFLVVFVFWFVAWFYLVRIWLEIAFLLSVCSRELSVGAFASMLVVRFMSFLKRLSSKSYLELVFSFSFMMLAVF